MPRWLAAGQEELPPDSSSEQSSRSTYFATRNDRVLYVTREDKATSEFCRSKYV